MGRNPGLDGIKTLLDSLGNPHRGLKAVHVAGTNGKGSCCWMISSILREAGYRVGSYLSPHICSYRERFAINGELISAPDLNRYLNRVMDQVPDLLKKGLPHPTEFEILTAMAFEYFRDQAVDLAVMEVGLGGRYDSTNVLTPLLSVVTTIDYDHTAALGEDLGKIAWNKAGIIKPGVPVVVGKLPDQARMVIEEHSRSLKSPLFYSSVFQVRRHGPPDGGLIDICGPGFNLPAVYFSLLGDYQLENLAVVLTAVHILGKLDYLADAAAITRTLARLSFPGRMQVLSREPLVIADAAHNPQGCRAVADSLEHLWPGRGRLLVCGMLDDKDARGALLALGPGTRVCIATRPLGERSSQWRRLGVIWRELFPEKEMHLIEDPIQAWQTAKGMLKPEEYMLISGSFYLLGAVFPNEASLIVNS